MCLNRPLKYSCGCDANILIPQDCTRPNCRHIRNSLAVSYPCPRHERTSTPNTHSHSRSRTPHTPTPPQRNSRPHTPTQRSAHTPQAPARNIFDTYFEHNRQTPPLNIFDTYFEQEEGHSSHDGTPSRRSQARPRPRSPAAHRHHHDHHRPSTRHGGNTTTTTTARHTHSHRNQTPPTRSSPATDLEAFLAEYEGIMREQLPGAHERDHGVGRRPDGRH